MKALTTVVALLLCLSVCSAALCAEAFAVRGLKGLWWEGIDKYRMALPWADEHGLNFLMTCYTSFAASGMDWRSDYTPEEKQQLRDLAADADRRGVILCVSFNPGIWSNPPLLYSSEEDYQIALQKVRTLHGLGVRWFALCLDDINKQMQPEDVERYGTLQRAQSTFVNRLYLDMKKMSPAPKLIFCPSAYTTREAEAHLDYITTIGEKLHPEIMVFWTGPEVCSPSISVEDARKFAGWIRRKPFVWDNYPVNDMFPWRPLLAPVERRSPDLANEVSGYMINPMKQWHATTLPLFTIAQYLGDPEQYNPQKARQTLLTSYPPAQRPAVQMLLDLYGSSFWGDSDFPPQPRVDGADEAKRLLAEYERLNRELQTQPELEPLYADVRGTLDADIALLKRKGRDRKTESPLQAWGGDFAGGGASRYGGVKFDRDVNFIYASGTGLDTIEAPFWFSEAPAKGALLHLEARNDDFGTRPALEFVLNGEVIWSGPSPFGSEAFTRQSFLVRADAIRQGENTLVIRNLEPEGQAGMPPWFMVAEAELEPVK